MTALDLLIRGAGVYPGDGTPSEGDVGVSEGVAARSLGKLSYGTLGGALGGFVGGALFGLIYMLTKDRGQQAALGGALGLVILGACIGAIVINMISATVSETEGFAEAWKVIIGLIFVLVVLYLPRGFAGLAHDLVDGFLGHRKVISPRTTEVSDASQLAE